MIALTPFSRGRACDKCGSIGARVEYVADCWAVSTEHLKRTCGECGFTWREATLDAKATNHAPSPTTDSPEAQGDGG